MMRNGQVFELPMQAHHTIDTESSSSPILRSPKASEGQGGALGEAVALERGNTVGVRDQIMDLMASQGQKVSRQILPTPTTQDGKNTAGPSQFNRNSNPLNVEAVLMSTPQVDDSKNTGHNQDRRTTLASQTWITQKQTDWGKFEPAIRRWEETIGREAPAPTKPDGKEGAHRLSSKFTEWMMGVPEGWITDVGLSRNDELKACGNGVVPQQAELALRILLEGVEIKTGGGQVNFPTPTVSDLYTGDLKSSQQKPGSMHSVTLPQAVRWVADE